MNASPHFRALDLTSTYNTRRASLPAPLACPGRYATLFDSHVVRGMPFLFGPPDGPNVVLLDKESVRIALGGATATYLLVVHVVEDASEVPPVGWARHDGDGDRLGNTVSEYELVFTDGSTAAVPVLRRFAIQQARCLFGSAPFACVPAADPSVLLTADEALALGRPAATPFASTRVAAVPGGADPPGLLWIYALPNPRPDSPLDTLICRPRDERSALYAASLTSVNEHPLRFGVRQKLRVRLPPNVALNAIGEVDPDEIGIDLGLVISARVALDYDNRQWSGDKALVQPSRSRREVVVEHASHPQGRLYLGDQVVALDEPDVHGVVAVARANRPVRLRFVDRESRSVVAVRLHLHGAAGEYLPPRGHQRKVDRAWNHDHYADLAIGENQYAYVDGECIADLPLGRVYVEVSRGYEIAPLREIVEIGPETTQVTFELERVLRWRERGWVTADTHVHFLSPQTALLEGRAEGVNVVNLLASQWGELFTNVGDFDGKTTVGAEDLGGRGEFLVRVGSENRMPVLGHISLLGYRGELIQPLCTAGPDEAAFGDPLELTMAEWAKRCLEQGGLVVMPHAPEPQVERAADLVLGVVDAIELMHVNPLDPQQVTAFGPPLSPYGLSDWYRYLNLGYHVPLVGGSDKMRAGALLGGIRTYAQLGERDLTYENWMAAIRGGNTFVTVGPLVMVTVEGVEPGGVVHLPSGGGSVAVSWRVESLNVPLERVEIVRDGQTVDDTTLNGDHAATGHAAIKVETSTWIAVRARGSYHGRRDDIAAHTSAVRICVDGSRPLSRVDSLAVLDQIQGSIAYVDTIAPRADARRFQELRATLEIAYNRLHQRMHAAGIFHRHPLHEPGRPHEH